MRALEGGGLRTFADPDPLVWERAERWWVWDADGRRYLDLYGGFAVAAIGYGHPRVVEAIRRQAGELIHCPSAHPSRARAEFLEALAAIAPPGVDRILPAVTGAMANELALAIARTVTGRRGVITFTGSYFGRSLGIVGLAGKARYREALGVPAGARFVPYPYPLRMGSAATDAVLGRIERLLAEDPGEPPAAVFLEPVQGNGGVVIPPPDFLPRLRELCDRTGMLLVVDEIQSGCGRTGRMWAVEHTRVRPDLVTVGKGIGGGMGVAAVLGRGGLLAWRPDTYSSTFLTNAVNLAAAAAAIGVLRDEDLPGRAMRLGGRMLERLKERLGNRRCVAEVRGLGLWAGIELVDSEGRPDAGLTQRVVSACRHRGVIVGRGGHEENVVKLSPALVIDERDLFDGLEVVAEAVERVEEGEGT